jgi:hypothetical protein
MRERDKIQHLTLSFVLLLAALMLMPPALAIAGVFLIGLVKECWDERYGSGFCRYDMLGNLLGMAAALALWLPLEGLLA